MRHTLSKHMAPTCSTLKHKLLCADRQWQLLQPMLVDSAMAWLDPNGKHGWAPPESPMDNIEPICAALNLCRFLILRETASNSNITQVCISALVYDSATQDLDACRCTCCTKQVRSYSYDTSSVSMLLQICTPDIYKQLQINTGLLAVALQAAQAQIEGSADVEMILAVSRGMEVLSRVRELLAKQG